MKILNLILICFTISLISATCKTNTPVESKVTASTYDNVLKKGSIKVGYIPYPPALIKDPNTKQLSGIFYDVLMEVGKNLDIKIDFAEEVAWGNMVEAVKTGKDDLICTAVYAKSQRGKFVDFTTPLYFSPLKAYTQTDNNKFNGDISKINDANVKIATIDGEAVALLAKTTFPNAKTVSLTQSSDVSQMLEEVATRKADVTFVEPVFANMYIKNNLGKIREVPNTEAVTTYPVVMMVGKDDAKFLSMINYAIQELHNNGFIESTIKKYEPLPNSFYRIQKPFSAK